MSVIIFDKCLLDLPPLKYKAHFVVEKNLGEVQDKIFSVTIYPFIFSEKGRELCHRSCISLVHSVFLQLSHMGQDMGAILPKVLKVSNKISNPPSLFYSLHLCLKRSS